MTSIGYTPKPGDLQCPFCMGVATPEERSQPGQAWVAVDNTATLYCPTCAPLVLEAEKNKK